MTAPAQANPYQIDEPSAVGERRPRPRIADMRGRVVLMQPTAYDPAVPDSNNPGKTQKRMTLNVIVLDGGPLEFGGAPEKYQPHTLVVPVPFLAEGVLSSHVNIVASLMKSLPSAQRPTGGVQLGRIQQGVTERQGNNPPWNLVPLAEDDPMRAVASQVLQQLMSGTFVNPEPQQTGAGMAAASAAPTPLAVAAFGQPVATAMQTNYAQATATLPINTSNGPVTVPQAQPVSAAPSGIPQALWESFTPEQRAALQPVPPAPAAPSIPPAPTGFPQQVWESFTDDQRNGILAANAAKSMAEPPF